MGKTTNAPYSHASTGAEVAPERPTWSQEQAINRRCVRCSRTPRTARSLQHFEINCQGKNDFVKHFAAFCAKLVRFRRTKRGGRSRSRHSSLPTRGTDLHNRIYAQSRTMTLTTQDDPMNTSDMLIECFGSRKVKVHVNRGLRNHGLPLFAGLII